MCSKSVRVIYIIYIKILGGTDFEHPIFTIISSQSCFIEMDLLQKIFHLLRHEKTIYSKLVNNLFKARIMHRGLWTRKEVVDFRIDAA